MAENEYPRGELLVNSEWLAAHSQDPGVRIIDCAAIEAYRRAHIPGAVGLGGTNPYIKDPKNDVYVMPPEPFADLMEQLGVSDETLVISYDDNNSLLAARLWWVLQYYGHSNAKVLNGGWHRWLYEGRPITTHSSQYDRGSFTASADEAALCRLDGLKTVVGSATTDIFDVRSREEYEGTNSRGNRRSGHVPGAKHIEWLDFITQDDNRVFKPVAEINKMLQQAGIEPSREVITYCQGGIRAAHALFVLRLMGFDRVRNYDGSMREWANLDETPLQLPG
jgi:thiosulfate/3-mercaptopyruvate sulfurtransferase